MEGKELCHVLEINLVSAQNLKIPTRIKGKTKTYAVVWVDDSSKKLRTRTDSHGEENPTWNDKFLFRVSSDFVNSATAGFNVQIYSSGHLKDSLVGTARCLLGTCLGKLITSVYVHRPSGDFQGILNVAAAITDVGNNADTNSDMFQGSSMVNFHELTRSKTRVGVDGSSGKSLFRRLRLVKSSASLSTMSAPATPLDKSIKAATIRTVKSDSFLSKMMFSAERDQEPATLKSSASASSSSTLSDDIPNHRV